MSLETLRSLRPSMSATQGQDSRIKGGFLSFLVLSRSKPRR